MPTLKEQYEKKVIPQLKKDFSYSNPLQVPKLLKVVINVGLGNSTKDTKFQEAAEETLRRITGQKPLKTLSKKSISNFKIREGQVIGMKVTLRGPRMYDFVDKLVNVALPRIRDFRGISLSTVDQNGNLNLGFREHIAFPEIKTDEIEKIHGLQVTIATNAKTREEGLALFKYLGFPFQIHNA